MGLNHETIIDIIWIMRDECHKHGLGAIDWEGIVKRLAKEGYLNEHKERDTGHDKKSSGNDDIIDPRD